MIIFVTGATGFIGSRVLLRLARSGHQLRCLVRKTSNTGIFEGLQAEIVTGDVTDRNSVLNGMKGCRQVVNLANLYSFWEPDKKMYSRVNIDGTRNVMECALEAGIDKVVHVSSVVIYGKPADSPFTEESAVGTVHFSEYSRTKYEGDLIAWDLYEKKRLPLVVVYPAGVLGPGDPKATGQYIMRLIKRKMPARVLEDCVFTFVDVKDVAEVICRAAEKNGNIGQKYLVGKERLSFGDINRMVSEISGVPLPKMYMPDIMTGVSAKFMTLMADIFKKPPLWGMATDQIRVMKAGVRADGTKVERELGIRYTPIRTTLEEIIASYKS